MKMTKKLYSAATLALLASSNAVFAVGCFPTEPGCDVVTVAEPGSMALVGLAVAGAVAVARRVRK